MSNAPLPPASGDGEPPATGATEPMPRHAEPQRTAGAQPRHPVPAPPRPRTRQIDCSPVGARSVWDDWHGR